ncbi:HD-GYP domain-containing protein [Bacillus suaedaesalsae]|uniref:HD-GYP domain-containing protein n=1 Tax=Bacillus suaedaesalsae TaxID=2810349 RepID=A0ABS2DM49_9BACI|nr:HD domain-containing phosphohydrolase [Bacillus suaedaesalsae]MBM6619140.1 hypothetical protein [Bacillus suaedaesalsae]
MNLDVMYEQSIGGKILFLLACIMTLGLFMSIIASIIHPSSYSELAFLGFTFSGMLHWGFYFIHHKALPQIKHAEHLSAGISFVLFVFTALYNPLNYDGMWIFLLYYPIFLGLLSHKRVFRNWLIIYLITYHTYIIFDHITALGHFDVFVMIIRSLFALGSSAIGFVILSQAFAVDKQYKAAALQRNIDYVIKVLYTFIPVVERKTQSTHKEIEETSYLMKKIAAHFPEEKIEDWEIELLSLMHYVSRIKWPDYMFEKKGKLSQYEFQVIQEHCYMGKELLGDFAEFKRVSEVFYSHHERIDGKGYPHQLEGNQIQLLSQILGVVESYIAMTKHRPYRSHLTEEDMYHELVKLKETAVKAEVVNALLDEVGLEEYNSKRILVV